MASSACLSAPAIIISLISQNRPNLVSLFLDGLIVGPCLSGPFVEVLGLGRRSGPHSARGGVLWEVGLRGCPARHCGGGGSTSWVDEAGGEVGPELFDEGGVCGVAFSQLWTAGDEAGEGRMERTLPFLGQGAAEGFGGVVEEAVHRLSSVAGPVVTGLLFHIACPLAESKKLVCRCFQLGEPWVELTKLTFDGIGFGVCGLLDTHQRVELGLDLLETLLVGCLLRLPLCLGFAEGGLSGLPNPIGGDPTLVWGCLLWCRLSGRGRGCRSYRGCGCLRCRFRLSGFYCCYGVGHCS